MTAWLINYHKWPSSLLLTYMPVFGCTDIFLGSFSFEKLWTHDPYHFLQPEGPYTLTPESPCTSCPPCGIPAAPRDTLCASRLALVRAHTPLCLCLLFSLLLLSLSLTFPAQPFCLVSDRCFLCLSLHPPPPLPPRAPAHPGRPQLTQVDCMVPYFLLFFGQSVV